MNLDKIFSLNLLKLWTKYDYIFSLEILWVLSGFKKIAKLEPFTQEDLDKIKNFLSSKWLKYLSYEKDEYFDDEKMLFIKWKTSWKTYIDLYISKSNKTLDILGDTIWKETDRRKKNYLIWKLLWYPDCCVKSFLENNYSKDLDFNLEIKNKTVWKFNWRLNNLINPYSLIPFFPCSYNCKEAMQYAENNLNILWKRDEIKNVFKNKIVYNDFWDISILSKIEENNLVHKWKAEKYIFNFT